MTNAFSKNSSRYGASTPSSTPYERARQVWDDRIGSAIVQARNWRLAALGGLCLNAALLTAYVAERRGTHVAAYVVPINEYGRPGRIEVIGKSYDPTLAEQGYFIADWIRLVRSRSKDPVVLRDNWLRAYDFMAPEGIPQLDALARSGDVFKNVGASAAVASISSIIPRGPRSFQVNWRESRSDPSGAEVKENWTAIITVTHRPPATETALRKNPLGIFITSFQMSKEL
jgi:type IV secretion system protein VirB5